MKPYDALHADTRRLDGRYERHCPHGIGHIVGHVRPEVLALPHFWAHGCDGCCAGWAKQLPDGSITSPPSNGDTQDGRND